LAALQVRVGDGDAQAHTESIKPCSLQILLTQVIYPLIFLSGILNLKLGKSDSLQAFYLWSTPGEAGKDHNFKLGHQEKEIACQGSYRLGCP